MKKKNSSLFANFISYSFTRIAKLTQKKPSMLSPVTHLLRHLFPGLKQSIHWYRYGSNQGNR